MMTTFAGRTSVPVATTKGDIQREIGRYGPKIGCVFDGIVEEPDRKIVMFHQRYYVQWVLPMPRNVDPQTERSLWRNLKESIAKRLAGIECGIESFRLSFHGHLLTVDGRIVGDIPDGEPYTLKLAPPLKLLPPEEEK